MNIYVQLIVLMLLGFQAMCVSGQEVFTISHDLVPLDESIIYGKLDNGLSYYIKNLPAYEEEVNLRFHVLAGSNHQSPDQLNMAHFVEHMAFKSSKHFPMGIRNVLVRKELDMSQRDISATAGAYNTSYRFNAPADNQEALETGLLWFKDISTGLHFKDQEINTERGVLIQEHITRAPNENIKDAFSENKLMVQLVPCKQNYSNYIEHHEVFNPHQLKQFYQDWYRPDLMAIVVVGKIDDVNALEKQIRDRFSDIKYPENPREIPGCTASFFDQSPKFAVVEKTVNSLNRNEEVEIELFFRDRKTLDEISSKKGIERMNKIGLLVKILNDRLRKSTDVYNSFFDIHVRHTHGLDIAPSSFKVVISVHNSREKEALQTFSRVIQQIRKYGILSSEFKEVKEERIDALGRTDLDESRYWLQEIKNKVVHKEILPKDKRGYLRNWLSNYELDEFDEFSREINLEIPEDIGVLVPAGHPAISYTEAKFRSLITNIDEDSISPYAQPEVPTALMSNMESVELKEHTYKDKGKGESGAREILLNNGVKIALKSFEPSSDPNRKRITLHGFKGKGALKFDAEDYFSAINAPSFIRNTGIRKFNKYDIQEYTSKNSLRITNLYINNYESGIKANADLNDIEKMLQLVYLFLSEPRVDSIAFEDWKVQQRYYQNKLNDSDKVNLDNNIKKFIGDKSGVSRGTERHLGLSQTNMNKGFEIYKELFGNVQDFTFVITGDFSADSIIPMINKYLGNLPSCNPKTVKTPNSNIVVTKPTGPVLVQFNSPDTSNKINYTYVPYFLVSPEDHVDWKEKITSETLGNVLKAKVRGLRFEKGYSLYSVGAGAKYNNYLNQHEISATFRCTPEEYPLLRDEFANIIAELKTELIPDELLQQALKVMRSTYSPSSKGNSRYRIQQKLYEHYRFAEQWVDQKEIISYIESLTSENILNVAQKYFKSKNLYEFVMTH